MCTHPRTQWSDRRKEYVEVPCRYCYQCRLSNVNDYVGRSLAEQLYSTHTMPLNLTYRGDTVNSAVLVYSDFQKFLKRLRRDGYNVRYIVAGEYGKTFGRSHWHSVLFFKGPCPDIPMLENAHIKQWPHGHVFRDRPSVDGLYYMLKYIQKERTRDLQHKFQPSTQPELGHEYFMQLAEDYARQGMVPRDWFYQPGMHKLRNGKLRKFMMRGVAKEKFFAEYLERYRYYWGKEPKINEWLENEYDKIEYRAAKDLELTDDYIIESMHRKARQREHDAIIQEHEDLRRALKEDHFDQGTGDAEFHACWGWDKKSGVQRKVAVVEFRNRDRLVCWEQPWGIQSTHMEGRHYEDYSDRLTVRWSVPTHATMIKEEVKEWLING